MDRVRLLPIALAVAVAAAASPVLLAQSPAEAAPTGITIKTVPLKVPPMPFPPDAVARGRVRSIHFIDADQMGEQDKLLEADAESSIEERTNWSALEYGSGEGGWKYRQVVCPALPNHLFLQFTRNNGAGDVSMFSASIPRHGIDGRVRIIPIQRRGYSLFSPAPINSITVSAFNHIRAEEHATRPPDWLTTGLCYAALAGAHPETVLLPDLSSDEQKFPAAAPAILEIPNRGGAIIRFVDVAASPHPMLWTMVFDGKGKLLKATHTQAQLVTAHAVAPPTDQPKVKPIPQTIVDLNPPHAK